MRRALVAGNWKMHGSSASVARLLGELLQGLNSDAAQSDADIVVCPSHPHLAQAATLCADSAIAVGGQDCSAHAEGAYTGEVAPDMLSDLGCQWVIVGHSERRQYHGESDAVVAAKLAASHSAGLHTMLCVGETRAQREAGQAEEVVRHQLATALENRAVLDRLVIAYEPVWAIGTGLTATPQQAQAMHAFIRGLLREWSLDADGTRVLYGGSVKAGNAAELFAEPDIDGALVGGASLEAKQFLAIIAAAAQRAQAAN